ncbi:MAG: glycosyltransferase [Chloroflexales bacterium]|nr:glycosyltransferase [Chloroflexales bacterium]
MRVLMLTQVLPYPPDSGPRVKTYNLLQYLAQQHEVTLVSLVRSPAEAARADALRPLCAEIHTVPLARSRMRDALHLAKSALSGVPFVISRDDCPPLRHLLTQLTARTHYDIIHADQLNMAQFVLDLPGGARVLDQHNAVWTIVQRMAQQYRLGPKRLFLEREARLLRRYEADVCSRFDAVLAVSEPDHWALEQAAREAGVALPPVEVVPITVDTGAQTAVEREPHPHTILSMATMFWPPNVDGVLWFARAVYPLVKAQVPEVRLALVGARPPASVLRLQTDDPSIVVPGYVDDPQPYLAASAALIVPVRAGGGMRVKILEALARGIPIVSTTVGYEGIALTPGEHLLVGDTPEAFAAALVRLLRSPETGRALVAAGRRRVEQLYDWRVANRPVGVLYERLEASNAHARAQRAATLAYGGGTIPTTVE